MRLLWDVRVLWGRMKNQVCDEIDFAISRGINFIDIYSSNPGLRSHIGRALEGRREKFIIQGHLCTTWENGQYLRTPWDDMGKSRASLDDQLRRLPNLIIWILG